MASVEDSLIDEVCCIWPSNNGEGSEEMHTEVTKLSKEGLRLCSNEKELATYIKRGFDKKFHPTWHCIVGRSYGSEVGHEEQCCLFYYLGPGKKFPSKWGDVHGFAILLFKTVGSSTPYLNEEDRRFCKSIANDGIPPTPPL
eukprot:TRINITY_DN5130_c0_g1_i1.p1 TRINITY_DN5130_c0_g1~~TRINITY_DN5130_c0_g1_i1.p1  ORF type:complete len:142 (+),score=35.31 TRINITY_DN5130_c0_g1_i1:158-583(+)